MFSWLALLQPWQPAFSFSQAQKATRATIFSRVLTGHLTEYPGADRNSKNIWPGTGQVLTASRHEQPGMVPRVPNGFFLLAPLLCFFPSEDKVVMWSRYNHGKIPEMFDGSHKPNSQHIAAPPFPDKLDRLIPCIWIHAPGGLRKGCEPSNSDKKTSDDISVGMSFLC